MHMFTHLIGTVALALDELDRQSAVVDVALVGVGGWRHFLRLALTHLVMSMYDIRCEL